ncbi:CD3072 family TudS-related putative desulfidase [Methanocaldococcus sp.]
MKSKKIAIVSHCILNQNSVVKGLERSFNLFKKVVITLLNNDYGIIQLPCPEMLYLGIDREGRTKEEYDTKEYRELCRNILKPIIEYLKEYKKENFKFILIGIEGSPTCGIFKTVTRDGLTEGSGILMEELLEMLKDENIKCDKIDFPVDLNKYDKFLKDLEKMSLKNLIT